MDNKKEYIICSAVWFDDGKEYAHQPKNIQSGIVVCGRRHHNCFKTAFATIFSGQEREEMNMEEKEQGFLTSLDRFVTREEAASIAIGQDQFKDETEREEVLKSNYLYSENIY